MTIRRPRLHVEPRLLSQEQAAAYCGVSIGMFVKAFKIRHLKVGRRKMYDRHVLDREIDRRSGIQATWGDEAMEAARAL